MDAPEFTELLRQHAGLIHKVAYAYCRDAADREDVVQEIAAQLWRSRERFDGRCKVTTWLYRVALNVAISFHRRERRRREEWTSLDEPGVAVAAPGAAEPGDDVERLLRCVDQLGAFDKALVLLYLEGADHASMAEVLGISVSNVGTKLSRIKDRLRRSLESRTDSKPKGPRHATR